MYCTYKLQSIGVYTCVICTCVCVRACVHAWVRACVRAWCVCVCVRVCVCVIHFLLLFICVYSHLEHNRITKLPANNFYGLINLYEL